MDATTEVIEIGAGEPMSAQPTQVQTNPVPAIQEVVEPVQEVFVQETSVPAVPPPAEPSGSLALFTGYANIGVGFIVLAVLGMYIAGLGIWAAHIKVTGRDEGIEWMERAVSTLFWLLVILGILRFVQYNPQLAMQIVAVVVVAIGGWLAIQAVRASGEGDDEH
jgi:hypothetical protein